MKVKKYFVNFIYTVALLLFGFNSVIFASGTVVLGQDVIDILTEVTQILLIIAAGVCVAKVIHIGILYVSSVAADKSTAKTAILPWLIGTFLCFGAAVIGPIVIKVFSGGPTNVLDY